MAGADLPKALEVVCNKIVKYGVTLFCPTIVTMDRDSYRQILPQVNEIIKNYGCDPESRGASNKGQGARIAGLHLEGPFISRQKKGAHPSQLIQDHKPIQSIDEITNYYSSLDNVSIVTIAPELDPTGQVIADLSRRGVVVSVGHSNGRLSDGQRAFKSGARFITHLFNAMPSFHHRDPGLFGLLTSPTGEDDDAILGSSKIQRRKSTVRNETDGIYWGVIADGIHTHPSALKIAYRANPAGCVLVSDAMGALGLEEGSYNIGTIRVQVRDNKATIEGTDTLAGSVAPLSECLKVFQRATGCSVAEALECVTTHPARVLGIANRKGTLNYGADADFTLLDNNLNVLAAFIGGECVHGLHNLNGYITCR